MVLKKKTKDNYGKRENPNDVKASVGPDFVGLGYNTKGRDYSPAWGGQFQNGGKAYKSKPMAQSSDIKSASNTFNADDFSNYSTIINKYPNMSNDTSYMYARNTPTGTEQFFHNTNQGKPVSQLQRGNEFVNLSPEQVNAYKQKVLTGTGGFAMGGALPGAVGFTYARTAGSAPANGKYTKKTKASAQNGKEMAFYQNGLDFTPKSISKNGSVIKDDRGQWAYPGEVTEIGSNNITMQGVDYPVLGVSDTGDTQMMQPNQDYKFDGEKVTEYPMMQEGGWLDKYQDGGNINKKLKEEAEEFLARQIANRTTMSQYTPKKGEAERLEKEKAQRREENAGPLSRLASNPNAEAFGRNIPDAALFALDVMTLGEGTLALKGLAKPALEAAGKYLTEKTALKNAYKLKPYAFKPPTSTQRVTRGPINYWEEPGFAKRNPNFNPEAYKNSPIGSPSASRDIPEGMAPYIKVDDVTPNVKPSWKSQELPGLHISATMEGGPISKIIEPKTGLINVDQALTIIGKESGGASKVDMIKQALGKDIPKKMDYNDFRKTVQDQLIPLDREVVNTGRSSYGLSRLQYSPNTYQNVSESINNLKSQISRFEKDGVDPNFIGELKETLNKNLQDLNNYPLENQTIRLSNKSKFGKGADTHGNPEETLGHIHFIRDAESPDVLTMTQLQSDAFQGTHRTMPKSKEAAEFSLSRMKKHEEAITNIYSKAKPAPEKGLDIYDNPNWYELPDGKLISKEELSDPLTQKRINELTQIELENFSQKSLLDKNHQERYLQELVDYAGKRGDINKIRVPTSETAAKVQGYKPVTTSSKVFEEYNKLKGTPEYEQMIANTPDADKVRLEKVLKGDIKGDIYDLSNETVLKKYSEQPKIIKKVFGVEPKTVKDSKGNSWYEFDIPAKFKGGKGEIKAFKDGGWLNKYK